MGGIRTSGRRGRKNYAEDAKEEGGKEVKNLKELETI
jgi:hypothetical protein